MVRFQPYERGKSRMRYVLGGVLAMLRVSNLYPCDRFETEQSLPKLQKQLRSGVFYEPLDVTARRLIWWIVMTQMASCGWLFGLLLFAMAVHVLWVFPLVGTTLLYVLLATLSVAAWVAGVRFLFTMRWQRVRYRREIHAVSWHLLRAVRAYQDPTMTSRRVRWNSRSTGGAFMVESGDAGSPKRLSGPRGWGLEIWVPVDAKRWVVAICTLRSEKPYRVLRPRLLQLGLGKQRSKSIDLFKEHQLEADHYEHIELEGTSARVGADDVGRQYAEAIDAFLAKHLERHEPDPVPADDPWEASARRRVIVAGWIGWVVPAVMSGVAASFVLPHLLDLVWHAITQRTPTLMHDASWWSAQLEVSAGFLVCVVFLCLANVAWQSLDVGLRWIARSDS